MADTREIHDPFIGKTVEVSDRLVDRLRGKYAKGPMGHDGEPEFGWSTFKVPPIHREAADEIERLMDALQSIAVMDWQNGETYAEIVAELKQTARDALRHNALTEG